MVIEKFRLAYLLLMSSNISLEIVGLFKILYLTSGHAGRNQSEEFMMKRSIIWVLALIVTTSFCIAWNSDSYASGRKIKLTFSSVYMNRHNTVVNGFKPWIKQIEKITDGKAKISYFDPGTLCPQNETWSSVVSGAVDVGTNYCPYTPGKFPLTEVMELPLIAPSSEAGSLVTWELYQKYPEWRKQFKDAKLLWLWTSATYQLHTKDKMVRTLEDLKGMRIIGWSPGILQVIKLLGGSPMEIAGLDTYLALERGMADGVFCPLAPIKSLKVSDSVHHTTIIDMMVGPFWAAINTELYNDLPGDVKQVFLESTGEKMTRICGQTLDQGAMEDSRWLKQNKGHEFYVVPEKEKERWFKAVSPMHEEWVSKMEKRGHKNARAILNDAIRLGRKYAKTTGRGYQD